MSSNKSYPVFDTSEIVSELEFGFQRFEKLNPVSTGASIPDFYLPQSSKWHAYFDEPAFLQHHDNSYLKKPLVLYFYSKHWGVAATEHLKQLAGFIQHNQEESNLLIIDTDNESAWQQIAWENNFDFAVYPDTEKQIAKLLKIYAASSPAWSRYAGIDENIPLPAIYVLGYNREVIYDFANVGIDSVLPLNSVAKSLLDATADLTRKKSA